MGISRFLKALLALSLPWLVAVAVAAF
jgi:4-amino-4-deoxy-L-arabinose transferase-like glycosyltransferase